MFDFINCLDYWCDDDNDDDDDNILNNKNKLSE